MATRTAGLTVNTVEPVMPSNDAVIDVVPVARPAAEPVDPGEFEIVAVLTFADAHVT